MNKIRSYEELITYKTFEERFKYLSIGGKIGMQTFGYDRYLNQMFYNTPEWKRVRDKVILRDNGCDLGVDDYIIRGRIAIHHINPITEEDVITRSPDIFNPDFLICVSHQTHNAIHYGDEGYLERFKVVERTPGDTLPWKS